MNKNPLLRDIIHELQLFTDVIPDSLNQFIKLLPDEKVSVGGRGFGNIIDSFSNTHRDCVTSVIETLVLDF